MRKGVNKYGVNTTYEVSHCRMGLAVALTRGTRNGVPSVLACQACFSLDAGQVEVGSSSCLVLKVHGFIGVVFS